MTTFASDGSKVTLADTPAPAEPEVLEVTEPAPAPEAEVIATPAAEALPAVRDDTTPAVAPTIPEFQQQDEWKYDWLEFEGDKLAIRVPKSAALSGLSFSQSKYNPGQLRSDAVQLFLNMHLSPESYERVIYRFMHPDDPDYTISTLGALIDALVKPAMDLLEAETKKLEAEASVKPKK